jgi:hypothetical protein
MIGITLTVNAASSLLAYRATGATCAVAAAFLQLTAASERPTDKRVKREKRPKVVHAERSRGALYYSVTDGEESESQFRCHRQAFHRCEMEFL